MENSFDNLIVLGRPACGKSEFIDFMKNIPDKKREAEFHISEFEEVDDFPWLWQLCLDDNEREKKGEKRLYTEKVPEGFTLTMAGIRGSFMGKFNEVIRQKYTNNPEFYNNKTLLIEFARGKGDGFRESLEKFDSGILKDSAILYINVSFEESYRRNDARYKKGLEGSILSHKVPDRDMYGFFIENDWEKITDGKTDGFLIINGIKVPFVSMSNEPELPPGEEIAKRYKEALNKLWELKIST